MFGHACRTAPTPGRGRGRRSRGRRPGNCRKHSAGPSHFKIPASAGSGSPMPCSPQATRSSRWCRQSQPGTTAGRYLDRRGGDSGYMAIFQLPELTQARRRVAAAGIRVVWSADLADIAGTHLHPKDVPGAIVSLDWADPPESWRWAGPEWTGARPSTPTEACPGSRSRCRSGRCRGPLGRDRSACPRRHGDGAATVRTGRRAGQDLRFVPPTSGRGEAITEVRLTTGRAMPPVADRRRPVRLDPRSTWRRIGVTQLDTGTEDLLAEIDDGVAILTHEPPGPAKRDVRGHDGGHGAGPRAKSRPTTQSAASCSPEPAVPSARAVTSRPWRSGRPADRGARHRCRHPPAAAPPARDQRPAVADAQAHYRRDRRPAAGAGLSLALACDLRYAAEGAVLTTAFARVGFSGDYGGTWFLTRLVGSAKARELYYFSDRLSAADAERPGDRQRGVPGGRLRRRGTAARPAAR